jgi:hypothetical protein
MGILLSKLNAWKHAYVNPFFVAAYRFVHESGLCVFDKLVDLADKNLREGLSSSICLIRYSGKT